MYDSLQQYRSAHPPREKRIDLGAIEIDQYIRRYQLVDELIAFGNYNNGTHTHPDFRDLGTFVEINDLDMTLEVYQKLIERDTVYNKRMIQEFDKDKKQQQDRLLKREAKLNEMENKIIDTEIKQLNALAEKYGYELVRNRV